MFMPSMTFSQGSSIVNSQIRKPFYSSVAIVNKKNHIAGSGVIVEKNCKVFVLTAAHVIEHMRKKYGKDIYIQSSFSLTKIKAKVVKLDSTYDLARLDVPSLRKMYGTFVRLANFPPLIGDTVWMISSPNGYMNRVTKGIMSGIKVSPRKNKKIPIMLISTTALGYFASSGAGLFNNRGEVIGIFHQIEGTKKYGRMPGGNYSVALPHVLNFLK